jgi:hypothetical protein
MERNYNNMHLDGTTKEQREMVHNKREIKRNAFSAGTLGSLVGAFMTLAIGVQVLGAMSNNLRKQGVM